MSTMDFEATSDSQVFEHGPTDLPPRPYIGGPDAASPWKPRKNLGTIPGSALDYVSSKFLFFYNHRQEKKGNKSRTKTRNLIGIKKTF